MIETITLASVAATTLHEGIKFLYAQAGEALRGWKQRKRAAAGSGEQSEERETAPSAELPAGVFGADPEAKVSFDLAVVDELADDLGDLRHALADYAEDLKDVDPADARMLAAIDGLRQAMEAVTGVALTFIGEDRATAGPQVSAQARVREVRGAVAVLRAEKIISGSAKATFEGDLVAEGGRVDVAHFGTIGGSDSSGDQ